MLKLKPFIICINIIDILTFANIYIKCSYNKRYKPIFLKKESEIYLHFHKNYNIPINTFIIMKLKQ